MNNAVIADVVALNGDTDKVRPIRREDNQVPASQRSCELPQIDLRAFVVIQTQ
jgi:hypothetical protein